MKTIKTLLIGIVLLFALVGVASAETHISTGTVSSYSMSSAGETYILDGDVIAGTHAFIANADNVTLDGQGYNVTFANNATGYGVLSDGKDSVTLKNINFKKLNESVADSFGVYTINHADNMTIVNCTSNVVGTGCYGINLIRTNGSHIINTVSASNTSHGLYLTLSNSSVIANSTGSSNTGHGLVISVSNNMTVENCTGLTNSDTTNGAGMYFSACVLSNMSNSTGASIAGPGLYLYNGANNCTLYNCTGTSSTYYGMYIYASNSSRFDRCEGTSSTKLGVRIANSTANTFSNQTVYSPYGNTPLSGRHLLRVGDSITEGGAGGTAYDGWGVYTRSALASVNTWSVSNGGIGGETAQGGRLRLSQEIEVFQPTDVTIMYGTNDLAGGRSQQDIIDDILAMAAMVKSAGATPHVMLTIPQSAGNIQRVYLDQNLSVQAKAAGYHVICAYDSIDSTPENGLYDNYVAARYVDGTHPNDAGNILLGEYIARNILATKKPYYGTDLSLTIDSYGNIINSRDVISTDTPIDASFYPNQGNLTVNISEWSETGICRKVWNESSEIHNAKTSHVIGDFPTNTLIQINRDGDNYDQVTSNETGYIDWTYSGGYSEHTFEAFAVIGDEFDTARHNASDTWSTSIPLVVVIVLIIFSSLMIAAIRGKLSTQEMTAAVIGLMILMLVITVGYGILSSFSGIL